MVVVGLAEFAVIKLVIPAAIYRSAQGPGSQHKTIDFANRPSGRCQQGLGVESRQLRLGMVRYPPLKRSSDPSVGVVGS